MSPCPCFRAPSRLPARGFVVGCVFDTQNGIGYAIFIGMNISRAYVAIINLLGLIRGRAVIDG